MSATKFPWFSFEATMVDPHAATEYEHFGGVGDGEGTRLGVLVGAKDGVIVGRCVGFRDGGDDGDGVLDGR